MSDDDDESRGDSKALSRLQGTMIGEAYDELIQRILSDETIPLLEWYIIVGHWMQRTETAELFTALLDRCKQTEINPSDSEIFKRHFIRILNVDIRVLFLEKLRDPVGYFSFMLANRRPIVLSRVEPLRSLGLE